MARIVEEAREAKGLGGIKLGSLLNSKAINTGIAATVTIKGL
jgi:hypothetical protein